MSKIYVMGSLLVAGPSIESRSSSSSSSTRNSWFIISRTVPWWMYFAPVYDVREIKVVVLPILFVTSYMVRVSRGFESQVNGKVLRAKALWTISLLPSL